MPPHLTEEAPPHRLHKLRAALRTLTVLDVVLTVMVLIGGLAFLRAFAGGEGVAAQRLAWQSLAWTFPLLWDLTAVVGSVLWIAAPRRTAAFRWGVFLNLTATIVSGLATGSQAYTLARDQVPQGWPAPAFTAGFAVPVLYSILTWAAASARDALTRTETPWPSTSSTAPAAATAAAARSTAPALATPPGPPEQPPSSSDENVSPPSAQPSAALSAAQPWPDPTPTDPTLVPAGWPSASGGAGTLPATPDPGPGFLTPSPGSPPAATSGPTDPPDDSSLEPGPTASASTPDDRLDWAVSELIRRAEAPAAPDLRPRDIDAEFPPNKDGWRILRRARDRVAEDRQTATAGADR